MNLAVTNMGTRFSALCLGVLLLTSIRASAEDPVVVRFNTTLGNIDVQMASLDSPKNVANFLTYANSGAYNGSFIHRSVSNFVIQGGGYKIASNQIVAIPVNAPVIGEHVLANKRGTLALALSTGPNSGTDQWFFNEVDNSSVLDGTSNGGPFTVFGVVTNASSLAVMDAIGHVPIPSPSPFGINPPFNEIPLVNYTPGADVLLENLVMLNSVTVLKQTFAEWQVANFTVAQRADATISGPAATPQSDGVPNLLKYLHDINPSRPMTTADRAGLSEVDRTVVAGVPYLTLTYRQNALKTGITIKVQTSTDLKTWTTVAAPVVAQIGVDATTAESDPILQVRVKATVAKLFVRLNVSLP